MNESPRLKRECDERLRSLVGAGERVLARGTATELRGLDDDGSGDWQFLVMTDRRLLSAHWGHPDRHEDLALNAVTAWADGAQCHRYLFRLTHVPMTRPQEGLTLFGRRSVRDVTRTSTVLRFSRRDTAVASSLRAAFSDLVVPHTKLALPERTRDERTRGSRVVIKVRL